MFGYFLKEQTPILVTPKAYRLEVTYVLTNIAANRNTSKNWPGVLTTVFRAAEHGQPQNFRFDGIDHLPDVRDCA